MIRRWHKITFVLFASFIFVTCIDPYTPDLRKFESRLVVDALVTDEEVSNYVRLSQTVETADKEALPVIGATVTISDDLGNTTTLVERYPGDYRTDSLLFRGTVGRTYTLHIETPDGDIFESEPCIMYPVPEIDSLYYGRDQLFSEETGTFNEGITFYIDTRNETPGSYYRWSYDEWWKFTVQDPKTYDYINDTTIIPLAEIRSTCYAYNRSNTIDIENTLAGHSGDFVKKPVLFVSSSESDRLLLQYCVEVRQMSLSAREYEFWNLMTEINKAGGDIFDKQPFQVFSNIINKSEGDDHVIGFFQVSAVEKKRMYVTYKELDEYDLPLYYYDCGRIEKGEVDYPPAGAGKGLTFNMIYVSFLNSGYTFIKPITTPEGELYRLAFVWPACADCTVRGSLKKPWFWVDLI